MAGQIVTTSYKMQEKTQKALNLMKIRRGGSMDDVFQYLLQVEKDYRKLQRELRKAS